MLEVVDSISFLDHQGKDGSAKKGGRPRKKDLDEKMDGVAKLVSAQIILNLDIFHVFSSQGSNMYFYTGPGGATNESPINSDDDEETVKVRVRMERSINFSQRSIIIDNQT